MSISDIVAKLNYNADTFANMSAQMQKRLSEVKLGSTVVITSFENDEIFLKLMEMGCLPGEKVTVDHIAPFKDPISIMVSGYRLSLRLNEAEHVFVEDV